MQNDTLTKLMYRVDANFIMAEADVIQVLLEFIDEQDSRIERLEARLYEAEHDIISMRTDDGTDL